MTITDWMCAALIGTYFVGVGATDVILLQRMGRLLQDRHPDAWSELGVTSVHLLAFSGYFRRNEHLGLHDPELNAIVSFKKRFDNVSGICFVVVALSLGFWLRGHR
jgi:hypothetical protein